MGTSSLSTWKRNQQSLKKKKLYNTESLQLLTGPEDRLERVEIWENTIFHYILLKKVHRSVFGLQELSSSQTPIKYRKSEQLALKLIDLELPGLLGAITAALAEEDEAPEQHNS